MMAFDSSHSLPTIEAPASLVYAVNTVARDGRDGEPERGGVLIDTPPRRIKEILPKFQKRSTNPSQEPRWYRQLIRRLKEDSQLLRSTFQLAFALLCIWIGAEFYFFVRWGTSGGQETYVPRPPGAEGFLPISGLVSLKYWIQTGIINSVHPAALFILLAVVVVSVTAKKSFCSWLCPIGTLSESLWMLGRGLFGQNRDLPRWIDIPLRSLKYLLLSFFAWSVWNMGVEALAGFIDSPYNRVADVKMYLFFAQISSLAFWVIASIMFLSVVIRNFWCRYLCPYGALLGIVGLLSPMKITRAKATCVDCELCTRACPANIKVHAAGRVWSDECTSCLACVQVCPVKNTLDVRFRAKGTSVPNWVIGTLVGGIFFGVTGLAMLSGHWHNSIPKDEYLRRFQQLDSPLYQHFRGQAPQYGPND